MGLLLCATANAQRTITYTTAKGALHGDICKVMLTEAYGRLSIQTQSKLQPAKRSLKSAGTGRVSSISKMWKSLIIVPTPIDYIEATVFTKDKTFTVWRTRVHRACGMNWPMIMITYLKC